MGQLGDLSPQASVAVGILVGLISTSVQSLGLTLQRKSHILEDEKDEQHVRRPPYRRRRWQIGMFMFIVSNLAGSSIQITTLPLPVLSTLQASGLVFNSICSSLILGEPFTRWSLGGTILVCGGAILIAIFGAIGEPAHNLDQLLTLLGRPQFIAWMIGTAILVAAIIAGAKALKYLNPWSTNSPRMRLFKGMAYGAVSGILSAHSLLVAKSAVELLVRTIVDQHNEFNRYQSWLILLGLIGLALSQLYYLHRGLKLCSTSILYPFVFCVYNIIAILDGLIYFDQSSRLTLLHALLIALGTIILLAGVLCLSWRLNTDPTTRPPVAQNPLTPGMGFVDDESDSSAETALLPPRSPDAESAISSKSEGGESSPFLPAQRRYRHRTRFSTTTTPRTPTSKNNDLLATTSRLRRAGPTESEEIWDELEDETFSPPLDRGGGTNSPSSPYYTPQQQQQQQQRRTFSTPQQSKRNSRVLFSNPPSQSTPDLHPSSNNPNPNPNPNPNTTSQNADTEDPPGEHTPLLLARSSTGRSYRANQRRRRSAPMLSIDTESAARGGGGGHRRLSEGGSERAQEAVGGWWRMRRGWWGGDDRGGDRGGGGREGGSRRGGRGRRGRGRGRGRGRRGRGRGEILVVVMEMGVGMGVIGVGRDVQSLFRFFESGHE